MLIDKNTGDFHYPGFEPIGPKIVGNEFKSSRLYTVATNIPHSFSLGYKLPDCEYENSRLESSISWKDHSLVAIWFQLSYLPEAPEWGDATEEVLWNGKHHTEQVLINDLGEPHQSDHTVNPSYTGIKKDLYT